MTWQGKLFQSSLGCGPSQSVYLTQVWPSRINIDAATVRQTHRLNQSKEKVIALQNGCICCNLRGDLLEEILQLWKLQEFDYIIIESGGITEPEQVAETFDPRLSDHIAKHGGDGLDDYTIETLQEM